jgi:hypothetical protein
MRYKLSTFQIITGTVATFPSTLMLIEENVFTTALLCHEKRAVLLHVI